MLSLILGFITGLTGPIAQVINNITELRKQQTQAKSNVELADINKEIELAESRKSVLIAEAGSRLNSIIRALAAIGPILFINKILVWDKVIGSIVGCSVSKIDCSSFRTDTIDQNMWWVIIAVIAFYFLADKKKS